MRREFATQGLHVVNSDIEVANADPGHPNWLPQVQTHAGVRAPAERQLGFAHRRPNPHGTPPAVRTRDVPALHVRERCLRAVEPKAREHPIRVDLYKCDAWVHAEEQQDGPKATLKPDGECRRGRGVYGASPRRFSKTTWWSCERPVRKPASLRAR